MVAAGPASGQVLSGECGAWRWLEHSWSELLYPLVTHVGHVDEAFVVYGHVPGEESGPRHLPFRRRRCLFTASRNTYSTWPFRLRNSSRAHSLRSDHTSGSMRRRMDFFLAKKVLTPRSELVQAAGVNDRLGGLVRA